MDIVTPNFAEIQKVCLDHVRKFPEASAKCLQIFGDSFKEVKVQKSELSPSTKLKPETEEIAKKIINQKTPCPLKVGDEHTSRVKGTAATGAGVV